MRSEGDRLLEAVDELLKISKKNRFMIYAYSPLPGSELYRKAVECGFDPSKTLKGWSGLLTSPEDVFENSDCRCSSNDLADDP